MMARHGDIFTGVRQKGVILGLEFSHHPEGAVSVSRALYEHGVWAIFSSLDKRVLQWKPGVLLSAGTVPGNSRPLRCGDAARPRIAARRRQSRIEDQNHGRSPAEGSRRRTRAGPHDAGAGALGRDEVPEARSRGNDAHRRCGGCRWPRQGAALCRMGGARDRHGRRRAQAHQERSLLEGSRRDLCGGRLRGAAHRCGEEDRRAAAPGRRDLCPDPGDQSGRHHLSSRRSSL